MNVFDFSKKPKEKRKVKKYIWCEDCVLSEPCEKTGYVRCTKYRMLSRRDATCKSSIEKSKISKEILEDCLNGRR